MPEIRTQIVFFGTPEYAVPTLRALASHPAMEITLVVTQPDRRAGRGHALVAPAVKEAARELGLTVLQPETLRDESVREALRRTKADLFVVAAYGLIFSQAILDIPAIGCLNLHASLLPRYRGAAPVAAAILDGEPKTGVTLMMMERGLDTGPIVASVETAILGEDTTKSLTARLAHLGAELATASIPRFVSGELSPVAQPAGATVVRQLIKADGEIDWYQEASQIERQVRAMWPWPRARTMIDGQALQILSAQVAGGETISAVTAPGAVVEIGGKPAICCSDGGLLVIERGQIAGGRPLSGAELVRGRILGGGMRAAIGQGPETPLIRAVD